MQYFFSFDVESAGLFGLPFAVGWVIVDETGVELDHGYCGIAFPGTTDAETLRWLQQNVLPVLPPVTTTPEFEGTFYALARTFWSAWEKAKQRYPGVLMVTDCPFPVEAKFLLLVEETLDFDASPYPVIDVASVLFARGMDPIGTYDRLPTELPAHHPTHDARQSIRVMLEALGDVARIQDLKNLDVPGLR